MRPVNDVIIVTPETADERTPGGIYLPDSARERTNRARVVAISPGDPNPEASIGRRMPPDCKVGDTVILDRYFGLQDLHELPDGTRVETVRFGEIAAVIEPDEPYQEPYPAPGDVGGI